MTDHAPIMRQPASYQDILDAPEGMIAEIIDGRLVLQPRPAGPHAKVLKRLTASLDAAFDEGVDGPDGWWIVPEIDVRLGEAYYAPDIAGWRRRRMPEEPIATPIALAPDWVCEIHSAGTRASDIRSKKPLYGRYGVRHLWFVDPGDRTLQVFEHDGASWRDVLAAGDDMIVRAPPFEMLALDLSRLWVRAQGDDQRAS